MAAAVQTKRKMKQIDRAPTKLKESELYNHSHYASLIDDIIKYVLPFWDSKWRSNNAFNSILNKKGLCHELEESIGALHFVLKIMNDIIADNANQQHHGKQQKLSIPVIDLCSGKGILSMLVVSFIKLVPSHQPLCEYVDSIYLLDRNWDLHYLEVEEMKRSKRDPTKRPKCPIKSSYLSILSTEFDVEFVPIRTDIHNRKIIEFLSETVSGRCKAIFSAIHLCRRLSVRAIELFNSTPNIYAFLLAPCCLPLRGGNVVRIGPLWTKTRDLWSNEERMDIDVNDRYLVRGITPQLLQSADVDMDGDGDEVEEKENGNEQGMGNEDDCCFQMTLMSKKQIKSRGKKLNGKYKLNEHDEELLERCDGEYAQIDGDDPDYEMCIVSELLPLHLHELDAAKRYNQWITFLFNGIDCKDEEKAFHRVPLTGSEHRCDAFLTVQRS